jgi:uncharacterized protein YndB with AHSA1/START domain
MPLKELHVTEKVPAEPARVWALLGDSRSWPRWTPLASVDILAAGGADGVDERRRVRNGRYEIVERILERVPARRLRYTVESGLGVRDYCATVTLSPTDDGATLVDWHTVFAPKVPGTGWMYRRALERATREFVAGLRAHAPRATPRVTAVVQPTGEA